MSESDRYTRAAQGRTRRWIGSITATILLATGCGPNDGDTPAAAHAAATNGAWATSSAPDADRTFPRVAQHRARIDRGRIISIEAFVTGEERRGEPITAYRVVIELDSGQTRETVEPSAAGLKVGDFVQIIAAGAAST